MEVERQSRSIVDCSLCLCSFRSLAGTWAGPTYTFPGRYERHPRCERDFGGDANGKKRGVTEVVNVAAASFLSARGATIKGGGAGRCGPVGINPYSYLGGPGVRS